MRPYERASLRISFAMAVVTAPRMLRRGQRRRCEVVFSHVPCLMRAQQRSWMLTEPAFPQMASVTQKVRELGGHPSSRIAL
jgi:hypothetical protein